MRNVCDPCRVPAHAVSGQEQRLLFRGLRLKAGVHVGPLDALLNPRTGRLAYRYVMFIYSQLPSCTCSTSQSAPAVHGQSQAEEGDVVTHPHTVFI